MKENSPIASKIPKENQIRIIQDVTNRLYTLSLKQNSHKKFIVKHKININFKERKKKLKKAIFLRKIC